MSTRRPASLVAQALNRCRGSRVAGVAHSAPSGALCAPRCRWGSGKTDNNFTKKPSQAAITSISYPLATHDIHPAAPAAIVFTGAVGSIVSGHALHHEPLPSVRSQLAYRCLQPIAPRFLCHFDMWPLQSDSLCICVISNQKYLHSVDCPSSVRLDYPPLRTNRARTHLPHLAGSSRWSMWHRIRRPHCLPSTISLHACFDCLSTWLIPHNADPFAHVFSIISFRQWPGCRSTVQLLAGACSVFYFM